MPHSITPPPSSPTSGQPLPPSPSNPHLEQAKQFGGRVLKRLVGAPAETHRTQEATKKTFEAPPLLPTLNLGKTGDTLIQMKRQDISDSATGNIAQRALIKSAGAALEGLYALGRHTRWDPDEIEDNAVKALGKLSLPLALSSAAGGFSLTTLAITEALDSTITDSDKAHLDTSHVHFVQEVRKLCGDRWPEILHENLTDEELIAAVKSRAPESLKTLLPILFPQGLLPFSLDKPIIGAAKDAFQILTQSLDGSIEKIVSLEERRKLLSQLAKQLKSNIQSHFPFPISSLPLLPDDVVIENGRVLEAGKRALDAGIKPKMSAQQAHNLFKASKNRAPNFIELDVPDSEVLPGERLSSFLVEKKGDGLFLIHFDSALEPKGFYKGMPLEEAKIKFLELTSSRDEALSLAFDKAPRFYNIQDKKTPAFLKKAYFKIAKDDPILIFKSLLKIPGKTVASSIKRETKSYLKKLPYVGGQLSLIFSFVYTLSQLLTRFLLSTFRYAFGIYSYEEIADHVVDNFAGLALMHPQVAAAILLNTHESLLNYLNTALSSPNDSSSKIREIKQKNIDDQILSGRDTFIGNLALDVFALATARIRIFHSLDSPSQTTDSKPLSGFKITLNKTLRKTVKVIAFTTAKITLRIFTSRPAVWLFKRSVKLFLKGYKALSGEGSESYKQVHKWAMLIQRAFVEGAPVLRSCVKQNFSLTESMHAVSCKVFSVLNREGFTDTDTSNLEKALTTESAQHLPTLIQQMVLTGVDAYYSHTRLKRSQSVSIIPSLHHQQQALEESLDLLKDKKISQDPTFADQAVEKSKHTLRTIREWLSTVQKTALEGRKELQNASATKLLQYENERQKIATIHQKIDAFSRSFKIAPLNEVDEKIRTLLSMRAQIVSIKEEMQKMYLDLWESKRIQSDFLENEILAFSKSLELLDTVKDALEQLKSAHIQQKRLGSRSTRVMYAEEAATLVINIETNLNLVESKLRHQSERRTRASELHHAPEPSFFHKLLDEANSLLDLQVKIRSALDTTPTSSLEDAKRLKDELQQLQSAISNIERPVHELSKWRKRHDVEALGNRYEKLRARHLELLQDQSKLQKEFIEKKQRLEEALQYLKKQPTTTLDRMATGESIEQKFSDPVALQLFSLFNEAKRIRNLRIQDMKNQAGLPSALFEEQSEKTSPQDKKATSLFSKVLSSVRHPKEAWKEAKSLYRDLHYFLFEAEDEELALGEEIKTLSSKFLDLYPEFFNRERTAQSDIDAEIFDLEVEARDIEKTLQSRLLEAPSILLRAPSELISHLPIAFALDNPKYVETAGAAIRARLSGA